MRRMLRRWTHEPGDELAEVQVRDIVVDADVGSCGSSMSDSRRSE